MNQSKLESNTYSRCKAAEKKVQMSQSKANGNRSLLGKDDVRGQISEHIFAPNDRGYCVSSKKMCIVFLQIFSQRAMGLKIEGFINYTE